MLTRKGFVSNSSSASYIINVADIENDEIAEVIYNNLGVKYSVTSMIEALEKQQETSHIDLELLDSLREYNEATYNHLRYMQLLCNFYRINYEEVTEKKGFRNEYSRFTYSTAMHNDYVDSMPEVMKDILVSLMYDTQATIRCETDSDF